MSNWMNCSMELMSHTRQMLSSKLHQANITKWILPSTLDEIDQVISICSFQLDNFHHIIFTKTASGSKTSLRTKNRNRKFWNTAMTMAKTVIFKVDLSHGSLIICWMQSCILLQSKCSQRRMHDTIQRNIMQKLESACMGGNFENWMFYNKNCSTYFEKLIQKHE